MKLIFLLLTLNLSGQNLYTNEPGLVYPILEEFISENFRNQTPTLERINQIDSILVVNLPYPLYGTHTRTGSVHTIKIHKWLMTEPKRFERTLKHELGHVFNLPHIVPLVKDKSFLEFMSAVHYEEVKYYYNDIEVWKQINFNYYQSLKK